ncbi:MAG: DNA polymerase IV, partial [Erysipelotrichaceae bacterium]|nr:DNA polymerase IV [Erysipelotrichaceae bacterium]
MAKVIFHIDLNAFFASAEIRLNPQLKDIPLAIAGFSSRSVVSTCNYIARSFGVKSAMSVEVAKKLCPNLKILNGNYEYYKQLSESFIQLVASYSTILEQTSIDECYIDVTELIFKYEKPLDLAYEIQNKLLSSLQLPSSIGIGPNKLLAKMASDMKKPMGITVIRKREVQQKLWPLPIEEMRYIGSKTANLLKSIGIHTISDLAQYQDYSRLKHVLGKNATIIQEMAFGIDHRELITNYERKSIGISTTLKEDTFNYEIINVILHNLSRQLAYRLQQKEIMGNVITLTIKYFDFKTVNRSKKLTESICLESSIYNEIINLYEEIEDTIPIRLLGISIHGLDQYQDSNQQLTLFELKKQETHQIINELNQSLKTQSL